MQQHQEERQQKMRAYKRKMEIHKKTPVWWAVSDPRIVVCKHSKFVTCRYCTPYYFNWEDVDEDERETPELQGKVDVDLTDAKFNKWKKEFLAQCKDAVMISCRDHLAREIKDQMKDDIMDDIWDEINDVLQDFRKTTTVLIDEKISGSAEIIKNQLQLPLMTQF